MFVMNATQVRKDWSTVIDQVVRQKPAFIKRTRDHLFLSDISTLEGLLEAYDLHAEVYREADGSVTISVDELDVVENAADEPAALRDVAKAILEYAEDYYTDFPYWHRGDRRAHLPYVMKALILHDVDKIGGLLQCRPGEN